MTIRNRAEDRLQMAVIQHLRLAALPRVLFYSIPNEGSRSERTGARLKAMGLLPGAPDIGLIIKGRAFGLELKSDKGRQTETQRAVEKAWEAAGGVYAVARGIDEALAALRLWGALPEDYAYSPAKRRQASLQFEAA